MHWGVPASIAFTLAAAGCGIDDFEFTIQDSATISGTAFQAGIPGALDYGAGFDSVKLETNKSFLDQGVSPDDVDGIFVKSVNIAGGNPEIDRLDVILESIKISVNAKGQPELIFASGSNFPSPSRAVDLETMTETNLKSYAVAGDMSVGAEIVIKTPPALQTTLNTTIDLLVDINLAGI